MPFLAALTGILTGEVGRWVTRGLDEWQKGREFQRQKEMAVLLHDQQIDLKDLDVFGKAQMDLSGHVTVSDKLNPWVFNILSVGAVGVEIFTKSVRPILSAAAVGILVYVYNQGGAQQAMLQEELVFTSCAVIRYWFGYREDMKKAKLSVGRS